MNAHSLKQDVLESLQRLPEDVDVDEMMYQLYVIDKLHKSREAIEKGDVISHADFKQEMKQW